MSMGRKRKPGPKRAPRKTGGIVKGTTQVMDHKREEIVRLRDMGHSGNREPVVNFRSIDFRQEM